MAAIGQAARDAKQAFLGQFAEADVQLPGGVAAQQAAITTAAQQAQGHVAAAAGAAQGVLQSSIAATLGKVTAAAARARASVGSWQGQAVGAVPQIYMQGARSIQQSAQATGQKGQQAAQQVAQQTEAQMMQAAQRGKALGEARAGVGSSIPEAAEKKAEAARDLGNDAYAKISESAAPTAQKLREAAPEFASGIQQSVLQVILELMQSLPQTLTSVQQVAQQTNQGIGQMLSMVTQGLSHMGATLRSQLAQTQGRARASIAAAAAEQRAALAQAGQQVRSSLQQERTATLQGVDENIEQAKQEVAGKPIPARSVSRIIAQVVPKVQRGLQPLAAATRRSIGRAVGGVRSAGTGGAAALIRLGSQSASGIHRLATAAKQAANRQGRQATGQLDKMSNQATSSGGKMLQQIQQGIAKAVRSVQNALGQQLGKFTAGLRQAGSGAVAKASEPLRDLGGRIASAQAKIETKYQEEKRKNEHRSLLERAWDAVTGWITAALNWIKDNWKLIVMVIAIVLVTVALGALALVLTPLLAGVLGGGLLATVVAGAVVGVGAGIVGRIAGQVITNVASGKSPFEIDWGRVFDPKTLLRDAVTGGVGSGVGQFLKGASLIKQIVVNAGVGLGGGMLGNVLNGESPFHDVKSLIIATLGGALGPIMGGKMANMSLFSKSAVNASVAFGTGVIDNVVHGRAAFDHWGDMLGSSVSAVVNTAAMERVGNNHPDKSSTHATSHEPVSPVKGSPPAAPPRESSHVTPPREPVAPNPRATPHEPPVHKTVPPQAEHGPPPATHDAPPPREDAHTPSKQHEEMGVTPRADEPPVAEKKQPPREHAEHDPATDKVDVKEGADLPAIVEDPDRPLGARGPSSGREFDPERSGGPLRELSTEKLRITERGIDVVEKHISRFGSDAMNNAMIERLRLIAAGKLHPTQADLNYYAHELREYVRYRKLGYKEGVPTNSDEAHDLWNNAHTATLEEYGLKEGPGVLYHLDVEAAAQHQGTGSGPAGGRDRGPKKTEDLSKKDHTEGATSEKNKSGSDSETLQERIERTTGVKKSQADEAEMAALREKMQRREDLLKAYPERYPNTTLTPEQLIAQADRGGKLNKQTGRVRFGNSDRDPDFRHQYKGDAENHVPSMEKYGEEYKALLTERDKAIKNRDLHPEGSDEYKSFQQEVVDASRKLGELSAKRYMEETYGLAPEYDSETSSRDTFDQVYCYEEGGVEKFIIIEAKGGKSPLSSRKVGNGQERAEQGTREYFEEIVQRMSSSEDAKTRDMGRKLSQVENPEDVVKYLHVETVLENTAKGSEVKKISVREFDLSHDAYNKANNKP